MTVIYKTKGHISYLELEKQKDFCFSLNPIDRCSVEIEGDTFIPFYKANEANQRCKESYLVDTSIKITAKTSELKDLVKIAFEQNKTVKIEVEITRKNNNSEDNNEQCKAEEQTSSVNNCCEIVLKKIKVLSGF